MCIQNGMQMAKILTDTSLRIDQKTRELLNVVSEREELPIKACVALMAEFVVKNRIGLKEEYVPISKEIERVIKMIRAQEKGYFMPILRGVNSIGVFQNSLIAEAQDRLEMGEEKPEDRPSQSLPLPLNIPAADSPREIDEKLQVANKLLLQKLQELTHESKLTVKTLPGGKNYVIRISEQELNDIRQTIKVCTLQ